MDCLVSCVHIRMRSAPEKNSGYLADVEFLVAGCIQLRMMEFRQYGNGFHLEVPSTKESRRSYSDVFVITDSSVLNMLRDIAHRAYQSAKRKGLKLACVVLNDANKVKSTEPLGEGNAFDYR